jgi:hypothetical protein
VSNRPGSAIDAQTLGGVDLPAYQRMQQLGSARRAWAVTLAGLRRGQDRGGRGRVPSIYNRSPTPSRSPHRAGHTTPLGEVAGRIGSRFTSRQRPRSPDRKASTDRRRMLGGSSALPDNLRALLHRRPSVGAVHRCPRDQAPWHLRLSKRQNCRARRRLPTTVQTTMHEARRLGHKLWPSW